MKSVTKSSRAHTVDAPYRRVEFGYDSQNRCVQRNEFSSPAVPATAVERSLYDGWNRVATMDGSNSIQQKFTWGLDITSSLNAAGGVGALLWIEDAMSGAFHFACSDGNGNVSSLIDGATKNVTASYEYGPLGESIRRNSSYADKNPYRFSTKIEDLTTGLLYYGNRYFKPSWAVWLSRDPIEEVGGTNLYQFCANNAINKLDLLGLIGYGTLPDPVMYTDPNHNYEESTGDASVASILSHITSNIGNSKIGTKFNNQAADYWTNISVLGLSGEVIDGTFGKPAQSLFQVDSNIKESLKKGDTVNLNHRVTWFASPRAQTIGHINIDIKGKIYSYCSKSKRLKWKFEGDLTADPDKFDFDQKKRADVTEEHSWGLRVPEIIVGATAGWFYIKFKDNLQNVTYEGYVN